MKEKKQNNFVKTALSAVLTKLFEEAWRNFFSKKFLQGLDFTTTTIYLRRFFTIDKEQLILELLNETNYLPMKPKEMMHFLSVPDIQKEEFFKTIDGLETKGKIFVTKKGKIMLPESNQMFLGEFRGTQKGFGFVVCENMENDVFIPPSKTNGALNKDKVVVRITDKDNSKNPEGEIFKIVERGKKEIVGVFEKVKGFGFVLPNDLKISQDILIKERNSKGAITGHIVSCKITKTNEDNKLEGEITEILGHKNDPGVDILSIVRDLNISSVFSEEVLKEANDISEEISKEEIEKRKDLRNKQTITIDGPHTKDVDDAVTITVLENGNFELGVHIADVTHYVTEGSFLDKEAYSRGTSVYLADRVIPMIPHKLSNGVCSLNANCERLALSCIMVIDKNGAVVSHEIANTVINVDKAINYDIVADILTKENSEFLEANKDYIEMLNNLNDLSSVLRKKRIKRGALEFDFPECEIIVNEKGKAVDVVLRERNVATGIIEECMLICNETIAETYFWLEMPFVFRTHEEPDSERLNVLSHFARQFGYHMKGQKNHAGSLQALLSKIGGTPEETIISRVMLRSLKQARYTAENAGHFGLCAKYYCHFTSPIRRYPDLQIHRIIKRQLDGETAENMQDLKEKMPEICKQCSFCERNAESCEREVQDMKKAEYMLDKIGSVYEGVISGVTSYGLFVVLPNTVEGMVELKTLTDDTYLFDKENLCVEGITNHKKYSIGQKVKVKVINANKDLHRVDFLLK